MEFKRDYNFFHCNIQGMHIHFLTNQWTMNSIITIKNTRNKANCTGRKSLYFLLLDKQNTIITHISAMSFLLIVYNILHPGTWKSTCTYSSFIAYDSPICCASLSTFYNPAITSCPNCSCGCPEAEKNTETCIRYTSKSSFST